MTGQDIRAFRQRERLTQRAFAALVGTCASMVSDWEREARDISAEHMVAIKRVMSGEIKPKPAAPTLLKPADTQTSACKACPYWRHMDGTKSATMYCAHLQETGHARTCGVERTYQRYRALSPLSLDAARAAELGASYGRYKAMGVI